MAAGGADAGGAGGGGGEVSVRGAAGTPLAGTAGLAGTPLAGTAGLAGTPVWAVFLVFLFGVSFELDEVAAGTVSTGSAKTTTFPLPAWRT